MCRYVRAGFGSCGCAERWFRIAISDLELHQLRLLRQELGIAPPPADNTENKTPTEETVAA
jgi:hypothetical protein